jgi:hypothetical protein
MDVGTLAIFFALFVALAGLSDRYGVDSRERFDTTNEGILSGRTA